jgi:hypothetical protein
MCSDQVVQIRGIEPVKVCGIRHTRQHKQIVEEENIE